MKSGCCSSVHLHCCDADSFTRIHCFFFSTPLPFSHPPALQTGGCLREQVEEAELGTTPPGSGRRGDSPAAQQWRSTFAATSAQARRGRVQTCAVCLTYIRPAAARVASEWKRWHEFNKLVLFQNKTRKLPFVGVQRRSRGNRSDTFVCPR